MKNFKLKSIAAVLFITTLLASCSSDNSSTPQGDGYIYKSAYVTNVVGPTTGDVGKDLIYVVSYQAETGCSEFNKMTDVSFDKLPGYQVELKYPATTCSKPDPAIMSTTYTIKPTIAGTFYLRFAKSESEYITTTVVVK